MLVSLIALTFFIQWLPTYKLCGSHKTNWFSNLRSRVILLSDCKVRKFWINCFTRQ